MHHIGYVKKNQVILNIEQFEYVCKLLNEALENHTRLDEHGAPILFCHSRRLFIVN